LSLHLFWAIALGAAALLWIYGTLDAAWGLRTFASVADVALPADADCPSISILFAARDEAEKLPAALITFLKLDYPRYEIVAVNDRSQDDTEQILKSAAQNNPRLKVVSVQELPAGWLGKPHALQKAYEQSTGEWLIFTDADVQFAPSLLRSAIALAKEKGWDHLTL
jgi:glycosyltransferase involved in cell wall biosynthesis